MSYDTYVNYRDKALEMVDEGLVDARHMVLILVKYMTNADVEGALDANELTPRFWVDEDEDAWLYESDDDDDSEEEE